MRSESILFSTLMSSLMVIKYLYAVATPGTTQQDRGNYNLLLFTYSTYSQLWFYADLHIYANARVSPLGGLSICDIFGGVNRRRLIRDGACKIVWQLSHNELIF